MRQYSEIISKGLTPQLEKLVYPMADKYMTGALYDQNVPAQDDQIAATASKTGDGVGGGPEKSPRRVPTQ